MVFMIMGLHVARLRRMLAAERGRVEAMEQLQRLHDEYEAYISHATQAGVHRCCFV
jgi:hypothetical protein